MNSKISFGTLQINIDKTVYEPAEDSFLLATYASSISGKILEIGCGTGIVSLSAAAANPQNQVTGVDINQEAAKCSEKNATTNNLSNCKFFRSDLFSNVKGKFNFILFNPPYLPTTRKEKLSLEAENAAYDGGVSGLEVFRRFSEKAPYFLLEKGKVTVIATSLNKGIEKTANQLEKDIGKAQILAQEKFFFEKIALIEAEKNE